MALYVLDSDHLSLHQRGHEALKKRLITIPPKQIAITIISAEEVLRGRLAQVRKASKPESRVKSYGWLLKTIDFLCGFAILKFDEKADSRFQDFRGKKIRIGTQDLKYYSCPDCGEQLYDRLAMRKIEAYSPAYEKRRKAKLTLPENMI